MTFRPRGDRRRRLAPRAALFVLAVELGLPWALAAPARADGGTSAGPAAATAFILGVTAGPMSIDLPTVNDPTESFGTHARFGFDLGVEVRPWLEAGVEVGFTMLGEADSLQAILDAQGSDAAAVVTHVQWLVSARARWLRGASRWSPYVRGGAGMATLWISAPEGLGSHASDLAWCAGAGLDFYPHPRLLLRAEGTYVGQAASGGASHHAGALLGVYYAMPWSAFGGAS